jgi:hypothetical protein
MFYRFLNHISTCSLHQGAKLIFFVTDARQNKLVCSSVSFLGQFWYLGFKTECTKQENIRLAWKKFPGTNISFTRHREWRKNVLQCWQQTGRHRPRSKRRQSLQKADLSDLHPVYRNGLQYIIVDTRTGSAATHRSVASARIETSGVSWMVVQLKGKRACSCIS